MLLLQTYLKNLKKKQKELSKKHPKDEAEHVKNVTTEEEEDSDLASIARELQTKPMRILMTSLIRLSSKNLIDLKLGTLQTILRRFQKRNFRLLVPTNKYP